MKKLVKKEKVSKKRSEKVSKKYAILTKNCSYGNENVFINRILYFIIEQNSIYRITRVFTGNYNLK